jgi:hypothetical protein
MHFHYNYYAKNRSYDFITRLSAVVFVLLYSVVSSIPAFAAGGNLLPPVDMNSTWNICQGYNNTKISHYGSDALSLDLTGTECDSSASGKTVRTPIKGVVYSYGSSYGSLCINTYDGRSLALIHIDSNLVATSIINAGQVVGSVAAPNTKGNAGISHLHVQMWSTPGCYNSNPIPFDAAHTARICGAPDFTVNGPDSYNNGTWSGTAFTARACAAATPTSASFVYRFYSPTTKHHLYTADQNEVNYLRTYGSGTWNYEGTAYNVSQTSACTSDRSVYRFYSEKLKTHLYTMDEYEKSQIIANYPETVWKYEGIAYCADKTQVNASVKPVYRFYSESLKSHLYTMDEYEKSQIIANYPETVWKYEGIAYYAFPE